MEDLNFLLRIGSLWVVMCTLHCKHCHCASADITFYSLYHGWLHWAPQSRDSCEDIFCVTYLSSQPATYQFIHSASLFCQRSKKLQWVERGRERRKEQAAAAAAVVAAVIVVQQSLINNLDECSFGRKEPLGQKRTFKNMESMSSAAIQVLEKK